MRVITETREVFKFSELSESAKSDAIQKFYSEEGPDLSFIIDEAEQIASVLGIELNYRGASGKEPCIFYSGFSSQGDGASFSGTWSYKKGSVAEIKAYAPKDIELNRIAVSLANLARKRFYKDSFSIVQSGRYCHEMTMQISSDLPHDIETQYLELFRDFARWIYKSLESEYDYHTSEDAFQEHCEANAYEFDSTGNLA